MSDHPPNPDAPTPAALADRTFWLAGLLCLVVAQAWPTLELFGPSPIDRLLDDEPVLSGKHPLHLYHGWLGARTLIDRGGVSCFDPAFHAGYPKTPVFDPGSRPAELALALVGGEYSPRAYKVSLAVLCLCVPPLLFAGARTLGLARGPAVLSCLMGQVLMWTGPGKAALLAGDIDLLLGSLLVPLQVGSLVCYHRCPGPTALAAVAVFHLVGLYAHPFLALLLLPVLLLYYLQVGARHRLLWHLSLVAALAAAVGANLYWLTDWVGYWWIRVPPALDVPLPSRRDLVCFLGSPVWGPGLERGYALSLVALGLVGLVALHKGDRALASRQLAFAALALLTLAVAGLGWDPFARLGAGKLLLPALVLLVVPAAGAVCHHGSRSGLTGPVRLVLPAALVALPFALWLFLPQSSRAFADAVYRPEPLAVGLGREHKALLDALKTHTDGEARILWEDGDEQSRASRWTALLPLLVERSFIGGLDADESIEHATTGLTAKRLGGRPLESQTDADLEAYCRRYNVGWVVCKTDEVRRRFQGVSTAGAVELPEGRKLLTLKRAASFALTGTARWRRADSRGILLADVVPADVGGGMKEVKLSLHYQTGMRVSPSRVKLEEAKDDPQDPIPFVRLKMSDPVGRVWITWESR